MREVIYSTAALCLSFFFAVIAGQNMRSNFESCDSGYRSWEMIMGRGQMNWMIGVVLMLVVAGCATGSPPTETEVGQGEVLRKMEPYEFEAFDDPDNILVRPATERVPADAVRGGTLRRVITSQPGGFNWLIENSVDAKEIQNYIHESFAEHDRFNPGQYIPSLAYKVTTNEANTEYTIHLREGVYWHQPQLDYGDFRFSYLEWLDKPREMTADDGAFYFEMVMNPRVGPAHLQRYFEDIESVEVLDRYTLRVTWKRPVYHSRPMTLLSYPLPRWLYERDHTGDLLSPEEMEMQFARHWSNNHPFGTGPYQFDRWDSNGDIQLVRNENYWGEAAPIDAVHYLHIPDPAQAFSKLVDGTIDFMHSLGGQYYRDFVLEGGHESPFHSGELEFEIVDQLAYFYLGWNSETPYFEDRRVRKAMTLALDRQRIIDEVFSGLGEVQTGPYYYRHTANAPDVKAHPFDLERAAELLDEAGWAETNDEGVRIREIDGEELRFEFELIAYDRPETREWVPRYQRALEEIGVILNPIHVDWRSMQHAMESRQFQAFTGGWGLSWEIDLFQIWHSSQIDVPGGANRVGFRHERADEIIEKLRVVFDEEERLELKNEFHRILHEEQPYTFFYAPKQVAAWNRALKNVIFSPLRPQSLSLPWHFAE